jgi:Ti-type conjugative transfer relaxase TraA
MAIYHFSGTIISRSQGRSAIACAAYRSATRLHDERYDKNHDYAHKQDVAHTEILLPEKAPEWMGDREKLWNAVESAEKRKDAQLAREFNFALPRELTLEQNIVLASEFVKNEFVSQGMVADLCIHNDRMQDGSLQPHAHVMLTLREVTLDGFGQKVREWNAKENLLIWREAWAGFANRHLFLHGHDLKIDHRSLKVQGIELEPQHKIGAAVAQERSARLEDHQRIARENGEKILKNPSIALDAITRQQSTFTHQDLARFVNRHTVDAQQFQAVYDKVKGSLQLVALGRDMQNRERFTTKELLAIETTMLERVGQLVERNCHAIADTVKANERSESHLSTEQQIAFSHLVSEGDLKNVIGYAGSGKSYLLGAAREAWEASGYRVQGVTLSGIAAENLEAGSGIESRTIASRTYYWDKDEQLLTSQDILVVDEAGMIGSRQLSRLLAEAHRHRAKVVLVGDPYQLQAIEAGAAFRAIAERSPTVALTEIRRQRIAWQREATVELATGKTEAALGRYAAHDHLHRFETQALAKQGLLGLWNDARISEPHKTQILLTYTREQVKELNAIARGFRRDQGELGIDHTLLTPRGERVFAEQDRVYFLKNDRDLGVKNGTLGTIERIQGELLVVRLDKSDRTSQKPARTLTFTLDRYNHLDHGYAATIHKAQGVTVDRSYILASRYMDGHATYVGLSRHRESADVFYSREEFANESLLTVTLGRERSKDVTLDYSVQETFVRQRGFDEKALPPSVPEKQALSNPSADFSEFKAKNPEQIKAIQEAIRPRHERLALEAEKEINALEKAIEKSYAPRIARRKLEKYASRIAKEAKVMAYLKEHNPALSQKIQGLERSYSLSHDLSL